MMNRAAPFFVVARRVALACALALSAGAPPAHAQDGRQPVVDAAAIAQADAVRGYPDSDPVGRIQM
ncbi:MAG: hypothetical protein RL071_3308, partial [Pseudomonadota bacterium]